MSIHRRTFLKQTGTICLASSAASTLWPLYAKNDTNERYSHEARYYEKLPNRKVKCKLCPRECIIDDQETGYCGVRENHGGTYYTLVHSRPCTAHVDPIEKKPLFHFLPGSLAFSIATVGCNVECKFCQNWQISQIRPEQVQNYDMPPTQVAALAKRNNSLSIAYTYSEPVIFTEYMYDCAVAGREAGIRSVMISNGYIQKQPMTDLCNVLHAVKIDLKAFSEKFYTDLVAGELKPVLDTLVLLKSLGMWVEIVYLVIPTHNDSSTELRALSKWIVNELGPDVPIHFSKFYPQYRLKNLPPTPQSTLDNARKIALDAGIHFCYIGNIPGHEAENTYCPSCHKLLIRRTGYIINENNLKNGKCSACQTPIPGMWI
ncbi:AmmeMemoRadiSam system radical SAM enzyme [candidate division KSB1 bacterium]|nr:AmmeMemoRadiSam system radical SAM enzyme [candidate division KSB1 bacterium]